jgi:hypothetical protein
MSIGQSTTRPVQVNPALEGESSQLHTSAQEARSARLHPIGSDFACELRRARRSNSAAAGGPSTVRTHSSLHARSDLSCVGNCPFC